MPLDYTTTFDKALVQLRDLQLDRALALFYGLLEEFPKDRALLQQIESIESKRPGFEGYKKFANHVFSQQSSQADYAELVVKVYQNCLQADQSPPSLSTNQIVCALPHLASSHLEAESQAIIEQAKSAMATDARLPQLLYQYAQALIQRGRFLRAREELAYLITYYGETAAGQEAVALMGQLQQRFVRD